MNTIDIKGKTYQDVSDRLEDWLQIEGVTIEEIVERYGTPIHLVRQMYDANGNLMERGQKTLCVFRSETGKISFIDKTTINRAFGVAIAERSHSGQRTTNRNETERVVAALERDFAVVNELQVLTESERFEITKSFENVRKVLSLAAERERFNAAERAKAERAITALVVLGMSRAEAIGILKNASKIPDNFE